MIEDYLKELWGYDKVSKKVKEIKESDLYGSVKESVSSIKRGFKGAYNEMKDYIDEHNKKSQDDESDKHSVETSKEYQKYDWKYFDEELTEEEREAFKKDVDNILRLTPVEYMRYKKFCDNHNCKCKKEDAEFMNKYPSIDIIWNPGCGIGHWLNVVCHRCGERADITDYESW